MSNNPGLVTDWSIGDIIIIAGQLSGKHIGIVPRESKLVDSWHLLGGVEWRNSNDLPLITHPSQLLPLMVCKLFIAVEDVRADRFYKFGDFHQTIYVEKEGEVKAESEFSLLDALTPQEYKEEDVELFKKHVDELIDTIIVLINITRKANIKGR